LDDAPLPEDIWDLPTKGEQQGSFANGAFFTSTNANIGAPSPASPQDWRKVS
jgi:hypothetical protein